MTGWTAFFSVAFGLPLAICLPVIALREFFYLHPLNSWEWDQWQMLLLFFIGSILAFASGILILLTAFYVGLKILRDIQDEKTVIVGASPIENEPISQVTPSPVGDFLGSNINLPIGERIESALFAHFQVYRGPLSLKDKARQKDILSRCPGVSWDNVVVYLDSWVHVQPVKDKKGEVKYFFQDRREINHTFQIKCLADIKNILIKRYPSQDLMEPVLAQIMTSYPWGNLRQALEFVRVNYSDSESNVRVNQEEVRVK